MSNRILYNKGTSTGGDVSAFVALGVSMVSLGRRLKSKLDAMVFGNPGDYAAVANELGLQDRTVIGPTGSLLYTALQQAQDLVTIVSNIKGQIDPASGANPMVDISRLDI